MDNEHTYVYTYVHMQHTVCNTCPSFTYVRTCTTHTYIHTYICICSHTLVCAHILYTCVHIRTYVCIAQTILSELVNIQKYVLYAYTTTEYVRMYVRMYRCTLHSTHPHQMQWTMSIHMYIRMYTCNIQYVTHAQVSLTYVHVPRIRTYIHTYVYAVIHWCVHIYCTHVYTYVRMYALHKPYFQN